ncbi:hypothetical protein KKH3_26550 [Pectobacterium actinidiae]|nr:hypothetical protein KKH3_26550 [Pectobacterium actinidiae]
MRWAAIQTDRFTFVVDIETKLSADDDLPRSGFSASPTSSSLT